MASPFSAGGLQVPAATAPTAARWLKDWIKPSKAGRVPPKSKHKKMSPGLKTQSDASSGGGIPALQGSSTGIPSKAGRIKRARRKYYGETVPRIGESGWRGPG